ncbi:MAG: glycosyltransferase family 4 protein [Desulfobacteraceae bacterium]|nr:glycosyltransferase family 4 protein [Desulfobacteraceae bacterium]MDH3721667.1 glycosyltransferase family 4 protein [Desulfobacteraceae bacterium]
MKIAQIIATFPPHHGGMGCVCFHNSRELARHGHDVVVFTLDYGQLNYSNDPKDFKVVRLHPLIMHGDAGMVPQLYSMLKRFDVVHLHYPFFGGAEYVYFASLFRKQKYILTYHMDVYGDNFLKRLVIGCYEPLLMKGIVRKATKIIALSGAHLKSSKAGKLVDWNNQVIEIPNGVDTQAFRPAEKKTELMIRYGLIGKKVILFVGNLLPVKGLHLLIDALSKIEDKNVVLLIVGGGYGEAEYKKQVKEKGLEDRVIFSGHQSPDKNLPAYYNLSDFLVLPSTHSESFGLVILEAMASGKPAIVSSLPGPSQLIKDGEDGLIARVGDTEDLKNKIEYLLHRKDICSRMGHAGRQKVLGNYSWGKIGERLERIFVEIKDS